MSAFAIGVCYSVPAVMCLLFSAVLCLSSSNRKCLSYSVYPPLSILSIMSVAVFMAALATYLIVGGLNEIVFSKYLIH